MGNTKIHNELSRGSYGQVIRCIDENQKEFVLKDPLNKSSIHQDIMIQSRFRKAGNVLKYFRLLNYNGKICPAIKYMEKGSLRSLLKEEKYLSESETIRLSYQLLRQISEMHRRSIIHRDIKSDNTVLDSERNAKLIDFGLSKYIPYEDRMIPLKNVNTYVPGTMFYMAPELLVDEPYTNSIDIWAFGIVAVEMITGCVPYCNCGPLKASLIIKKKKKIKYTSPQNISKEFTEFIDLCLEPDSSKRLSADNLIEMPIFRDFSSQT